MASGTHLFVLVHGLWGSGKHMRAVKHVIEEEFSGEGAEDVELLIPRSNENFRTYDGITTCGDRVNEEILMFLAELLESGKTVTSISFVGYSMGGIIVRYCIGKLYEMGFFDLIKPRTFTTFASPYVGVHFLEKTVFDRVRNVLGKRILGQSGRDMFHHRSTILLDLTDENLPYYKALSLFEHRYLFTNVRFDRAVPFYTGFITDRNPWKDWKLVDLKFQGFEKGQTLTFQQQAVSKGPLIVDLETSKLLPEEQRRKSNTVLGLNGRLIKLYLALIVLVPIIVPIALCFSVYGTIRSAFRVSSFECSDLKKEWSIYCEARVKRKSDNSLTPESPSEDGESTQVEQYIDESDKDEVEELLAITKKRSRRGSAMSNEAADVTERAIDILNADAGDRKDEAEADEFEGKADESQAENLKVTLDKIVPYEGKSEEFSEILKCSPKLELTTTEQTIIKRLNTLDWEKYAVYVTAMNSHASIIARRGEKESPQGSSTLRFWITRLHKQL